MADLQAERAGAVMPPSSAGDPQAAGRSVPAGGPSSPAAGHSAPADAPSEPDEGPAFETQARLALQALAELDGGRGVSLPRLAKRTGLRVSVLLRLFTLLSDARVGDTAGPGWVRLVLEEDGRWMASMTAAGRGDPEQWDHSTP